MAKLSPLGLAPTNVIELKTTRAIVSNSNLKFVSKL